MGAIALIPARGGSKGVPGKNIAPVLGKPLIAFSIEVAIASNAFSEIWVSSDDEAILNVARQYPEVKIHHRDGSIAQDHSHISLTIKEILDISDSKAEALVLLQPTSPMRTPEQVIESIAYLEKYPEANSVISVCAMHDMHPARMYWIEQDEPFLKSMMPELENTRRQEIPAAWYRNGAIYVVRKPAFYQAGTIMAPPSVGYAMPASQLLNIDEPRDILIAEVVMKEWLKALNK